MKIKLSIDRLTTNRIDVQLEIERTSLAETARYASEDAHKYRAALEAITAAGQLDAHAIAQGALA